MATRSALSAMSQEVAPRWMMALADGALLAERMDMGHDIVPQVLFQGLGPLEVDVVQVRPHLGQLGVGDRQAQFLLGLGQRQPEPPPRAEPRRRAERPRHLLAGIPRDQRRLEPLVQRRVFDP